MNKNNFNISLNPKSSFYRKEENKNLIYYCGFARELGIGNISRDVQVIRKLYNCPNAHFEKIYSTNSSSNIIVHEHVFFENFTKVFSKDGKFLYSIDRPKSGKQRILGILPVELPLANQIYQNKFFALTENGYLQAYHMYSGKLLFHFLTSKWDEDCKFRYLCWENPSLKFYIKSNITKCKKQSKYITYSFNKNNNNEKENNNNKNNINEKENNNNKNNINEKENNNNNEKENENKIENNFKYLNIPENLEYICVALFETNPFRLICKIRLYKHIFGNEMREVSLLNDVLWILHSNDDSYAYSFPEILKNSKILVDVKSIDLEAITSGIPDTHFIQFIPKPLTRIYSVDHFLDFGSQPLITITASRPRNSFKAHFLSSNQAVPGENLFRQLHSHQYDEDLDLNFYDNSYKLLQTQPGLVTVYSTESFISSTPSFTLNNYQLSRSSIKIDFQISLKFPTNPIHYNPYYKNNNSLNNNNNKNKNKNNNNNENENNNSLSSSPYSRSGRQIRYIVEPISEEPVPITEFENELDILLVASHFDETIYFYDNRTGNFLLSLNIPNLDFFKSKHSFLLDRDILLHLEAKNSNCKITAYKLSREEN